MSSSCFSFRTVGGAWVQTDQGGRTYASTTPSIASSGVDGVSRSVTHGGPDARDDWSHIARGQEGRDVPITPICNV